jgi:hypothetical protein
MFGEILQKFAEKSPVTVMVRGLLEHLLNADQLDHWFESTRQKQYTRDILFSSLVGLMLSPLRKVPEPLDREPRTGKIAPSVQRLTRVPADDVPSQPQQQPD